MAIKLAANAVKARVFDIPKEIKLFLTELLSFVVESAEQSSSFKAGRWDGRSSFFDYNTGTFPAGFAPLVARELRKLGHEVTFIKQPAPAPLGPELGTKDFLGFGFDPRYDYQLEAVRSLLRHGRMIARVATGGGKTNIAILAIGTIRRPTLFLTTRSVLMYQMKANLEKAGFTPGVMGDGVWAPRRGVNVAMVQSIMPRLAADHPEREAMIKLLQMFEVVIGEEAHEVGAHSYFNILNHCSSAHYRLALTATPFMRDDAEANMRLMAAFGPIGIEISEEMLIDRGILARPIFKIVRTPSPPLLRRSTPWPSCYDVGIVENTERNRAIVFEAHRAAAHGLSVLTLVQRRKHGEILLEAMRKAGLRAKFIFGDHEAEERSQALEALRTREIDVLIGSTILDVGVDAPAVGMIILAGGGKAEVGMRQRIGRGLRSKRIGPNICHVVDFADDFNRTLMKHALTRRAIIESTPGFRENLLQEGGDFDYEPFQLAEAA